MCIVSKRLLRSFFLFSSESYNKEQGISGGRFGVLTHETEIHSSKRHDSNDAFSFSS